MYFAHHQYDNTKENIRYNKITLYDICIDMSEDGPGTDKNIYG